MLTRLAHDAGLQVVAEFVSNDETMRFLEEQGIEYAQGCFLGKPEEFAAYRRVRSHTPPKRIKSRPGAEG